MKKIVCKGYFLTDYEKEEKWLHDMRLKGWELTALPFPCVYVFERAEPKDVTYRLEFRPDQKDRDAYIDLVKEYGWSFLKGQNSWLYFWKETSGQKENNEIFSDDYSRMQMVKKTATARFIPCLLITAAVALMFALTVLPGADMDRIIECGVLLLMLAVLDVHLLIGYRRLAKKYSC